MVKKECCIALTPTLSLAGEGVAIAFIDSLLRGKVRKGGAPNVRRIAELPPSWPSPARGEGIPVVYSRGGLAEHARQVLAAPVRGVLNERDRCVRP